MSTAESDPTLTPPPLLAPESEHLLPLFSADVTDHPFEEHERLFEPTRERSVQLRKLLEYLAIMLSYAPWDEVENTFSKAAVPEETDSIAKAWLMVFTHRMKVLTSGFDSLLGSNNAFSTILREFPKGIRQRWLNAHPTGGPMAYSKAVFYDFLHELAALKYQFTCKFPPFRELTYGVGSPTRVLAPWTAIAGGGLSPWTAITGYRCDEESAELPPEATLYDRLGPFTYMPVRLFQFHSPPDFIPRIEALLNPPPAHFLTYAQAYQLLRVMFPELGWIADPPRWMIVRALSIINMKLRASLVRRSHDDVQRLDFRLRARPSTMDDQNLLDVLTDNFVGDMELLTQVFPADAFLQETFAAVRPLRDQRHFLGDRAKDLSHVALLNVRIQFTGNYIEKLHSTGVTLTVPRPYADYIRQIWESGTFAEIKKRVDAAKKKTYRKQKLTNIKDTPESLQLVGLSRSAFEIFLKGDLKRSGEFHAQDQLAFLTHFLGFAEDYLQSSEPLSIPTQTTGDWSLDSHVGPREASFTPGAPETEPQQSELDELLTKALVLSEQVSPDRTKPIVLAEPQIQRKKQMIRALYNYETSQLQLLALEITQRLPDDHPLAKVFSHVLSLRGDKKHFESFEKFFLGELREGYALRNILSQFIPVFRETRVSLDPSSTPTASTDALSSVASEAMDKMGPELRTCVTRGPAEVRTPPDFHRRALASLSSPAFLGDLRDLFLPVQAHQFDRAVRVALPRSFVPLIAVPEIPSHNTRFVAQITHMLAYGVRSVLISLSSVKCRLDIGASEEAVRADLRWQRHRMAELVQFVAELLPYDRSLKELLTHLTLEPVERASVEVPHLYRLFSDFFSYLESAFPDAMKNTSSINLLVAPFLAQDIPPTDFTKWIQKMDALPGAVQALRTRLTDKKVPTEKWERELRQLEGVSFILRNAALSNHKNSALFEAVERSAIGLAQFLRVYTTGEGDFVREFLFPENVQPVGIELEEIPPPPAAPVVAASAPPQEDLPFDPALIPPLIPATSVSDSLRNLVEYSFVVLHRRQWDRLEKALESKTEEERENAVEAYFHLHRARVNELTQQAISLLGETSSFTINVQGYSHRLASLPRPWTIAILRYASSRTLMNECSHYPALYPLYLQSRNAILDERIHYRTPRTADEIQNTLLGYHSTPDPQEEMSSGKILWEGYQATHPGSSLNYVTALQWYVDTLSPALAQLPPAPKLLAVSGDQLVEMRLAHRAGKNLTLISRREARLIFGSLYPDLSAETFPDWLIERGLTRALNGVIQTLARIEAESGRLEKREAWNGNAEVDPSTWSWIDSTLKDNLQTLRLLFPRNLQFPRLLELVGRVAEDRKASVLSTTDSIHLSSSLSHAVSMELSILTGALPDDLVDLDPERGAYLWATTTGATYDEFVEFAAGIRAEMRQHRPWTLKTTVIGRLVDKFFHRELSPTYKPLKGTLDEAGAKILLQEVEGFIQGYFRQSTLFVSPENFRVKAILPFKRFILEGGIEIIGDNALESPAPLTPVLHAEFGDVIRDLLVLVEEVSHGRLREALRGAPDRRRKKEIIRAFYLMEYFQIQDILERLRLLGGNFHPLTKFLTEIIGSHAGSFPTFEKAALQDFDIKLSANVLDLKEQLFGAFPVLAEQRVQWDIPSPQSSTTLPEIVFSETLKTWLESYPPADELFKQWTVPEGAARLQIVLEKLGPILNRSLAPCLREVQFSADLFSRLERSATLLDPANRSLQLYFPVPIDAVPARIGIPTYSTAPPPTVEFAVAMSFTGKLYTVAKETQWMLLHFKALETLVEHGVTSERLGPRLEEAERAFREIVESAKPLLPELGFLKELATHLEAIRGWTTLEKYTSLRRICKLIWSYFHAQIPNFATLAPPVHPWLRVEDLASKNAPHFAAQLQKIRSAQQRLEKLRKQKAGQDPSTFIRDLMQVEALAAMLRSDPELEKGPMLLDTLAEKLRGLELFFRAFLEPDVTLEGSVFATSEGRIDPSPYVEMSRTRLAEVLEELGRGADSQPGASQAVPRPTAETPVGILIDKMMEWIRDPLDPVSGILAVEQLQRWGAQIEHLLQLEEQTGEKNRYIPLPLATQMQKAVAPEILADAKSEAEAALIVLEVRRELKRLQQRVRVEFIASTLQPPNGEGVLPSASECTTELSSGLGIHQ